ncbi:MAG: septum formation inhibitor Maf, partial [Verrucomicrobia bacterium]
MTLASASPRRRELLASLGLAFRVVVPKIDETLRPNEGPHAFAERLAEEKANAVDESGIVIAADTIVVQNETILGKPADAAHAREMLRSLSGAMHEVVTGVCIKNTTRSVVFSIGTHV